MDPYFTTDLDYAFGLNSGFNPETDMNVRNAEATAKAKAGKTRNSKSAKTKASGKRLNYDGMSFDKAFAAALRAGKSSFNWRGKEYTTQLAPQSFEVAAPTTVDSGPMEKWNPEEDTSLHYYTPAAAGASYQADAGLRRAAMAPVVNVPINGVQVPQYGNGGWLLPL